MPTYEFRCPQGHVFDKFYSTISASESQTPCPQCGEVAERQISGGAGLHFKGSGFYLTDYGKNAHRGGGAPKGEAASPSKASDSKPAESKPAESKPSSSGSSGKSGGE